MHTYTQIVYQIVFSTKYREPVLLSDKRPTLFAYIAGVLKKQSCHVYAIGGVEDHLHIITHLHPSVSLAGVVKDIKLSSSTLIRSEQLFAHFNGWQSGYAGFTYSKEALPNLIRYVQNQEAHHKRHSFLDELISLLKEHGIEYDEKYLP